MATSKQNIQESMMHTAASFWGLPDQETEAAFDPVLSLLISACATELDKINYEIENSRTRVLERLVQLLSPEALTGVLAAHGIASVTPTEEQVTISSSDQFYINKQVAAQQDEDGAAARDIYFSPAGNFQLHKSAVKYLVCGKTITSTESIRSQENTLVADGDRRLPAHHMWIGVEGSHNNINGLRLYFDVVQQSQKDLFFNQLPKTNWSLNSKKINKHVGYPVSESNQRYFDIDAVLNRDVSVTEKWESHIRKLYGHHFVTLSDDNSHVTQHIDPKKLPQVFLEVFNQRDLNELQKENIFWITVEFPENIGLDVLNNVNINTNCFPIINRQLNSINYLLKDVFNIVPLTSEDAFLDVHSITNQHGEALHILNDNETENGNEELSVLLRYAGVNRFDKRDATEMIDKLIHLLREETVSFSTLGTNFLQAEVTSLQQTINKINQQIASKQLLKNSTPYLIIKNKIALEKMSLFVKFWSSNGSDANMIKAGTPINVYNSSNLDAKTAKLITSTQGGRNKLNDSDKVLAYKTALLSKQKIVTNEDIIAFCKLRMALAESTIKIQKGTAVLADEQQGLVRTLDVHIDLVTKDFNSLLEKGSLIFWQKDVEAALEQHSNFFIPVRVFIRKNN